MRKQNPLGKIPTLILDDAPRCSTPRVILEYFDHIAGGNRIIPAEPKARFEALRLQALADGILDAGVIAHLRGPLSPGRKARAEMGGAPDR